MSLPFVIKASGIAQQVSRAVLLLGALTLKELTALCVNPNTGWEVIKVARVFKSYKKTEVVAGGFRDNFLSEMGFELASKLR